MRRDSLRALSSTLLAFGTSSVACAADDGPASQIEEVIVTAQKREQSLQDVPASLAAFTADAIEQRGVRDVQSLQFQTPNLQAGSGVGVTQVSIRGVGMNLTAATTQPGVGLYVDGVYQARTALAGLGQLDLARVEVLRGPQGTLYGRNATGGAVNFITNEPTQEFEGHALVGFGEYQTYRAEGLLNAPLGDRVRARLIVDYRDQQDGYVENIFAGSPDVDRSDTLSARLKIAADLSEDARLDVSLFGSHSEGAVDYLVLRSAPSADSIALNPVLAGAIVPTQAHRTSANGASTSDRDIAGGTVTLTWDIGAATIKSISGYSSYEYTNGYDADGTNVDFIPSTNVSSSDTWSQEFNLSGSGASFDWLVGLYYMNDELTLNERFAFPSGLSGLPAGTFLAIDATPYETEAYAAFADASLAVTERLKLLAGVRYSKERQSVTQSDALGLQLGSTEIPLVDLCSNQRTDLDFESVTPRGGLQFNFDDHRNVYATVSRGYKAGGVNESSCTDNTYEPEKLTAYEVGFRGRIADDRVTLNATAFHYDYTDFQVQQILGLQASIVNAPEATVAGLEIETVWTPDAHWSLNAALSVLDSEYGAGFTNTDVLNRGAGVLDLEGNRLNRSPKTSGNAGVQYETDPMAIGRITARADLYVTDSYFFREFNTAEDEQGGYEILNVSIGWSSPQDTLSARLYAKNLTNAEYITTLGAAENVGSRFMTWGAPREIGVELRARF